MTTTTKITRQQAEAALAAVKAQWAAYLAPTDDSEPLYPAPTLVEDWADEDGWAICWEEGPDDWAMRVNSGDSAESDYVMAHDAAVEFGAEYDPAGVTGPGPAPNWPADVWGEPYYSFVLSLYPA